MTFDQLAAANSTNRIKRMTPRKKQKTSKSEKLPLVDGHKLSVDSPEWAAAQTIGWILYTQQAYSVEKAIDLMPTLTNNASNLKKGDLQEAERILLSQVEVLQALFNRMVGFAAFMMAEPEVCDRYASLGLRAQEQCRKTLVALAELKNPKKPTQFIKNYVDKQLNQLKVEQSDPSATKQATDTTSQPLPNPQVMEASPDAAMDTRSETTPERTDSNLETVGVIHRSGHE